MRGGRDHRRATAERSGEPAANLDCAFPLVWNEVRYVAGVGLPATSELGPSLGQGVVLGCGSEELGYYPDEDVDVRSVQGVDPAVAVAAVLDDPSEPNVWLAPGYLVESPRHPLHEAIAGSWGLEGFEDFACEETFTTRARGPVDARLPGRGWRSRPTTLRSRLSSSRLELTAAWLSTPETAISGLERHGAPYVEEGDEFVLVVSTCEAENDPTLGGPLLLAKSLGER